MPTEEELNAQKMKDAQHRLAMSKIKEKGLVPGPKGQPAPESFHDRGMRHLKGAGKEVFRGLSGAMTESAFRSFGKAFEGGGYTPRGMRPDEGYLDNWTESGKQVAGALENRWHAAEFENFKKELLDPFQENMGKLLVEGKYLGKKLTNGRWHEEDGTPVMLDFTNPADQVKAARYRAQLEGDMANQATEAHISLMQSAATKYANNPIVDNMIAQMMQGATAMLQSQFKKPDMSTAQAQSEIEGRQAASRLNTAQARVQERSLTERKPYKSLEEAMTGEGAPGMEAYVRTAEGQELIAPAMARLGPPIVQQYITDWRNRNPAITDDNAHSKEVLAWQEDMLRKRHAEIEQLILGAALEEAGGEQFRRDVDTSNLDVEADQKSRGLFAAPKEPVKMAITTAPNPKETRQYKKQWEALSLDAGQRYAESEEGFGMDKDQVAGWVVNEWLPHAMTTGKDLQDDSYLKELRGLTADPDKKATKSYVAAIKNSVKKAAAKFLEVGPAPSGAARRRRATGATGRAAKSLAGKFIPDFLSEFGEDVYPQRADDAGLFPEEERAEGEALDIKI
jgi:hypothetical protein